MKGWRTLIFNFVSGIIAAAAAILEYIHVLELSPEVVIIALLVVNIGNTYLRSITTSPLGKKV